MPSEEIEEALHIRDTDDMDDLIKKMNRLEEFYNDNERFNGFSPFIRVYRDITVDVNDLYAKNAFNNPELMEELDLVFAEQYLKRMRSFILHGEKQTPWKHYIEYCTREDRYESLSMILGINAHINGDLLHSINHVGLEDAADYNRVNSILDKHLSENIHYLILQEHDRLAFYAELVKPVTRYELHETIIQWREDIWSYRRYEADTVEPLFETAAEKMAEQIIDLGHHTNFFTLPIASWRLHSMQVTNLDRIAGRLPDPPSSGGRPA